MNYFGSLINQQLKKVFSFGGDSVLWTLTSIFRTLLHVFVVFIAFSHVLEIQGYSKYDYILIYSLYSIAEALFYMFFSWTLWFSSGYVVSGELQSILTKPVNNILYLTGVNFAVSEVFFLIVGLITFCAAAILTGMSVIKMLLLLILIIPAVLCICGFFLLIAAFSVKVFKLESAFNSLISVMEFGQYPTKIYPKFLRFILSYVFPVSLIAFVPAEIVLKSGFNMSHAIGYSISLFVFAASCFVFNRAVTKFEGTGN